MVCIFVCCYFLHAVFEDLCGKGGGTNKCSAYNITGKFEMIHESFPSLVVVFCTVVKLCIPVFKEMDRYIDSIYVV